MNIPDDNNSASELSPKLLQTVQMRHGCKVEIKEEVIHENNLSMDIESLDVSASL
jgi:predicted DNA-binding antitoxin AbrB/MazE fold protein